MSGLARGAVPGYAPRVSYNSPLPYIVHRLHVAAIYCSDGRVGKHFDDFLQAGLNLPHYDRVALPGGAACLADHAAAHVQQASVAEELKFLVEVHELERVVLIAHQGCGFYRAALGLPDGLLEGQQRMDLAAAARTVRTITGIDRVEGWFLRVDERHGTVSFEPVPLV